MVKLGKSSKRTPVRLRHKIEKAAAAKQRKQRRLAKKNPEWRSKIKKDPGVPSLFPFKDEVLHDLEQRRARARAGASAADRDDVDVADVDVDDDGDVEVDADVDDDGDVEVADAADIAADDDGDGSNPMAALLASARARAADYRRQHDADADETDGRDETDDSRDEADDSLDEADDGPAREGSRRQFDKEFKQVVSAADVVLYVLDARDPQGTRSSDVERQIMAADGGAKRLILVVNKIDLVPPAVLAGWLAHLRRYFPTLPFTAAPTGAFDHKLTAKSTAETLFRALKSYAQLQQLKRSVAVGVIGYPNVGKSSVINALAARLGKGGGRGAGACPTGAEAGVTTRLRQVKLDGKLKLIDSPGIVFAGSSGGSSSSSSGGGGKPSRHDEQARLVLLNAIPPKQIDDPVPAVRLLLKRLAASDGLLAKMLDLYGIAAPLFPRDAASASGGGGDKTTDFLIQVARKRGRLGRGGVPNINSAAMAVLTDWRDGRIHGWVDAPAQPADTKEVVAEWAKEFDL